MNKFLKKASTNQSYLRKVFRCSLKYFTNIKVTQLKNFIIAYLQETFDKYCLLQSKKKTRRNYSNKDNNIIRYYTFLLMSNSNVTKSIFLRVSYFVRPKMPLTGYFIKRNKFKTKPMITNTIK